MSRLLPGGWLSSVAMIQWGGGGVSQWLLFPIYSVYYHHGYDANVGLMLGQRRIDNNPQRRTYLTWCFNATREGVTRGVK